MIDPQRATIILICFIALFGVGLPVLNLKFPKYISYRWCVVVVVLALLIGAVVDFERLNDDARKIILTGGLIIVGGYALLRTLEKILANDWLKFTKIELKKGDMGITAEAARNAPKDEGEKKCL